MDVDHATEELLTELQGISEKNRELHLQINELRKDRALWKDALKRAAEKDSEVQQLNLELNTLQGEVTRLKRANEELQKKLEQEFEESNEARLQWQEQENQLRKALLEERNKHKDLKEKLKFYTIEANPSPITPEASDDEETIQRRKSLTNAMQAQIAKLKLVISDLHAAISLKDKKIKRQEYELRKQNEEIAELQQMMTRVMDELEQSQENALYSNSSGDEMSDDNTQCPSPSSRGTSPSRITRAERLDVHWSHKRSQSDNVFVGLTPPKRSRAKSASNIMQTVPELAISNSLLDELSKLQVVEESPAAEKATSSSTEEGPLRKKLSALGLSTEGNRKALKKRLHGYIKRREKILAKETATADQKLKAVKDLHAARA